MQISDWGKRLLIGQKLRTDQQRAARLRKRIAMPVFASNALSSIAYAPDERPLWVIAVLHGRRNPRVLAAILRGREGGTG
jgi:hypothetical protein